MSNDTSVWGDDLVDQWAQGAEIVDASQVKSDDDNALAIRLTGQIQKEYRSTKEANMHLEKDFVSSAKVIWGMNQGKDFDGTDEEAAKYAIEEVGQYKNALFQFDNFLPYTAAIDEPYMANQDEKGAFAWLQKMTSDETTDLQKLAFVHLVESDEAMDANNWNEVKRMGKAMVRDPSSLAGFGTLIASGIKFGAKALGKQTALEAIKASIKMSAIAGADGALFTSAFSYLDQDTKIAAMNNGYIDPNDVPEHSYTQDAVFGGIGAVGGVALSHVPKAAGLIWDGLGWVVDKTHVPGQLNSGIGPKGPDIPTSNAPEAPVPEATAIPPVDALPAPISQITPENIKVINKTSKSAKVDASAAQQAAQKVFDRHAGPEWTPIQVDKVTASKKKKTIGEPVVQFKKIPYGFDQLPEGVTKPEHINNMSTKMVGEVTQLIERANGGDKAAVDIIGQANWYRSMRVSLRKEFGGMGDLFADLLGATSANTDVRSNWNLSIEAIRRFSNGDFDAEIKAFTDRKDSGEKVHSNALTALHKTDDFPLITQASGALFGMNSVPATNALAGFFRDIKAQKAPKTINFTGNLIGFSDAATIDVWAARYLRYLTGQSYIPPVAEQGVKGTHLTKSTLQNPVISGEFTFGQNVFNSAAKTINDSGIVKAYDESLGDMTDADLQAVAWFMEKEKWTNNGWTTKAGEGGDMDFEASLAGNPNRERIQELRQTIDTQGPTPEAKAAAQAELDTMGQRLERTVLGISGERPGAQPSNDVQADIAQALHDSIKDDPSMIASKISNSYGRFMKEDERALDAEFVTRSDFDPLPLTRALVESGKKYDQDAVFKSKVVKHDAPNARPGLEVYFRNAQGSDKVRELTDRLSEMGVDGFTFVTDARQADRTLSNSGDEFTEASMVGVRLQYIPEFEMGAQEWKALTPNQRRVLLDEREDMLDNIALELSADESLSSANMVHYDTEVYFRGDYDEFLTRTPKESRGAARSEQLRGSTNTQPNSSGKDGQVSPGSVSNGKRKTPRKAALNEGGAL